MTLTDIQLRTAKPKDKPYKLSDAGGLYVLVQPNGAKYWRLKYRISGKEKLLSFGSYPLVTLSVARDKAIEAKEKLANNIDPSQAKKDEKQKLLASAINSFETVARCWHNNQKQRWTERHASYVLRRMEADIFPKLGPSYCVHYPSRTTCNLESGRSQRCDRHSS